MSVPAAARSAPGVAFVRRRTLTRAFRTYADWIGRAVGWATIFYLVFWLVVFAWAAVEALVPLSTPLVPRVPDVVAVVVAFWFVLRLRARRPPVTLSRTDVYRLALAPAEPWSVLRWPFVRRALGRMAVGALAGGVWTAVSWPWFGVWSPWAAPALAALFAATTFVAWLVYDRRGTAFVAVAAALALAGLVVPPLGLAAALYEPAAWTLLLPFALLAASAWSVRASLAVRFPPRFAAQSFILAERRSALLLVVLGLFAGAASSFDPGEFERRLAALEDRQGAVVPRVRLRAPRAGAGARGALAWRTNLALLRRPAWVNVFAFVLLVFAGAVAGLPGAGGVVTLLLAVPALGYAAALLVGPALANPWVPVAPVDRRGGRITTGVFVATFVLGAALAGTAAWTGATPEPSVLLAFVTLPFAVLVTLEAYSSYQGVAPTRPEVWIASALFAAGPLLAMTLLGYGDVAWVLQVTLAFVLYLLPV